MKLETMEKRLAERFGIEVPDNPIPPTEERLNVSRQAEAVLAFFEEREIFVTRNCLYCGDKFATNLGSVAYCKDECRINRLKELGIRWNPDKSQEERWNGPLVVLEELEKVPQYMEKLHASRQSNIPLVVPADVLNNVSQVNPVQNELPDFPESINSLEESPLLAADDELLAFLSD